ncbi:SRPBCC family protein [Glycomyces buryatensis]|uniref:SRPBCC domain-containing protein n=1 Tax=Glycomyces buryatensis TaxID=2570927 RepID=A0A4S8QDG5_9ACTN|nr:SRPBCC domain-containing protein [Glycomyces buryatensis]THV41671.1 SRPBCC domain-containing protein [Glycomyces buryatensis]
MVDILHRIGVEGSTPEDVYDALTTLDGLTGWWTEQTTGDPGLDGVTEFRFERGGFDMKVVEAVPGRRVLWEVVGGEAEWIGTKIHWDLRQEGPWTVVLFKHEGWREPSEFMHHCSTKWASFLFSLKDFVQNGKGAPAPNDFRIDDWD